MRKQIFYSTTLLLLIYSCSSYLGVKELGHRIYLDENQIIITESDKYKGIGYCIIPPTIDKIKNDEKFVIVRTLNGNNQINYWLIDKGIEAKELQYIQDSLYGSYYKYSNVYGPMDSMEFLNLKKQKNVKINWSPQ